MIDYEGDLWYDRCMPRLELHGNRALTLNKERTLHRMARAAIVKDTREAFGWMAKAQGFPKFEAAHITATPLAKDKRWRQDVGACMPSAKAAIDGLVDVGILPDDNPDYVKSLTFLPAEIGDVDGLRIDVEVADV